MNVQLFGPLYQRDINGFEVIDGRSIHYHEKVNAVKTWRVVSAVLNNLPARW